MARVNWEQLVANLGSIVAGREQGKLAGLQEAEQRQQQDLHTALQLMQFQQGQADRERERRLMAVRPLENILPHLDPAAVPGALQALHGAHTEALGGAAGGLDMSRLLPLVNPRLRGLLQQGGMFPPAVGAGAAGAGASTGTPAGTPTSAPTPAPPGTVPFLGQNLPIRNPREDQQRAGLTARAAALLTQATNSGDAALVGEVNDFITALEGGSLPLPQALETYRALTQRITAKGAPQDADRDVVAARTWLNGKLDADAILPEHRAEAEQIAAAFDNLDTTTPEGRAAARELLNTFQQFRRQGNVTQPPASARLAKEQAALVARSRAETAFQGAQAKAFAARTPEAFLSLYANAERIAADPKHAEYEFSIDPQLTSKPQAVTRTRVKRIPGPYADLFPPTQPGGYTETVEEYADVETPEEVRARQLQAAAEMIPSEDAKVKAAMAKAAQGNLLRLVGSGKLEGPALEKVLDQLEGLSAEYGLELDLAGVKPGLTEYQKKQIGLREDALQIQRDALKERARHNRETERAAQARNNRLLAQAQKSGGWGSEHAAEVRRLQRGADDARRQFNALRKEGGAQPWPKDGRFNLSADPANVAPNDPERTAKLYWLNQYQQVRQADEAVRRYLEPFVSGSGGAGAAPTAPTSAKQAVLSNFREFERVNGRPPTPKEKNAISRLVRQSLGSR